MPKFGVFTQSGAPPDRFSAALQKRQVSLVVRRVGFLYLKRGETSVCATWVVIRQAGQSSPRPS
jgi:hypothetical protein